MPLGANKAAIMGVAGTAVTGDVVLLATETISADATIEFTSGIDSTYGEYIFGFYNIHPATDGAKLTFQCSIDGGSNYNLTHVGTGIQSLHGEGDAVSFAIDAQDSDTTFFGLSDTGGTDNDQSAAGELHLFNPSGTTYVKHFISKVILMHQNSHASTYHTAGYFNTTDNIDAVQFKAPSGNLDTGTIKMWGVK